MLSSGGRRRDLIYGTVHDLRWSIASLVSFKLTSPFWSLAQGNNAEHRGIHFSIAAAPLETEELCRAYHSLEPSSLCLTSFARRAILLADVELQEED